MSKFYKGQRVIVKDNPTWGGGKSFDCVDPLGDANPGTMLIVVDPYTDMWGDIQAKPVSGKFDCTNWFYISEDSVVSVENDVRVGDKIRVYSKLSEIAYEGVVTRIDDDRYVWIGNGSNMAYSKNYMESVEVTILERAKRWPDHEGFIRITGGELAGKRGLVYTPAEGVFRIRLGMGGYRTEDVIKDFDPDFDFEYVEG